MCSSPAASSSRARLSGPASIGLSPPSRANVATASLAALSSPAISTSTEWPETSPGPSVRAKVVLNALTKRASGASAASSCAADPSGGTTSPSNVSLTGLVMSTTGLPASWSAYCSTAALASG
jgi:hypothetical protein